MFVFCHTFSLLWKFTFLMFWEMHGFLLHAKYVRNPWLWNVLFSHTFLVLSEFTFPMFWRQYYWYHFHSNTYVKLFTKEVILSLSRTEDCISNPFCHRSMEIYTVWKSRQCLVQQCFNWNITMNRTMGICLKIDPSGLRRNVSKEIFRSLQNCHH